MTRAPLDSFETALLTELRQEVAARATSDVVPAGRLRHRLVALGATAATAGAIAIGALALRPEAAFAVERQDDGDVVVTVRSWDDAEGLEEALAAEGVDAVVEYDDTPVAPAPDDPGVLDPDQAQPAEGGTGDCAGDIRTDFRGEDVTFRLPASAVDSDAVLHLVTAGGMDSGAAASLAMWWEGDPC